MLYKLSTQNAWESLFHLRFQFVKQLSSNSENTVIGSARDPVKATELQALADSQKNVKLVKLDVSDKASIDALDAQLKDERCC